ncbi:MAG: single-stranded-DNA-specific exonuclease RecJ [Dehalococcoidia bacterium]|nr:single-stranded-DNA-specific exonuclease RecJ [Dehalococcoidia bacterium]MDZ4245835.1 single-stranded-DNA-specific exonuclease RecJ [Dehalococcoidia bacterium]
MKHKRWKVLSFLPDLDKTDDNPHSPLISQLLLNRGLTTPELCRDFISGNESLAGDPFLLPDIPQAIGRIFQAILRGEKITVYGDFDADGITGTALLVEGLTDLGAQVEAYLPDRHSEGHGLKTEVLESLKEKGSSLVITVDCGITDTEAADFAGRKGLDLIITDHHTLTRGIPECVAVINPDRDDSLYPFKFMAGAGVAFKLLEALFHASGRQDIYEKYADLAAIGTIADMVPLIGDNRFLVLKGLPLLKNSRRPGLRELIKNSGVDPEGIDADAVAWSIGPRLNTASRIDHALLSYKLLTTSSAEEAKELARELEKKNTERQRLTEKIYSLALEQVQSMLPLSKILVVSGSDYSSSVNGIVAGRLVDEFYRPSIVIEKNNGEGYGSARSIPEFDMIGALSLCGELLSKYGGHPGAAGFSLPVGMIPALEGRLLEIAARELEGVDLIPEVTIDAEIPLVQGLGTAYKTMQSLAPFGKGNPLPTFLSRGVKVVENRYIGDKGKHVRFKLMSENVVWQAIGFGFGEFAGEFTQNMDIVYTLNIDRWGGAETIELNLKDFRPSGQD